MRRTKTLKLARRMISYNITYDAAKKTDEKYVWKFVVVEYFSYVGNINNKRRRLIGYL